MTSRWQYCADCGVLASVDGNMTWYVHSDTCTKPGWRYEDKPANYRDTPIAYTVLYLKNLRGLTLGYHAPGHSIDFDWRPYHKRRPEARADYDKLIVSIFHDGIRMPLITYQNHVLIGMRRAEIGLRLGIDAVTVWDITEDVSTWGGADIDRLQQLKAKLGEWEY